MSASAWLGSYATSVVLSSSNLNADSCDHVDLTHRSTPEPNNCGRLKCQSAVVVIPFRQSKASAIIPGLRVIGGTRGSQSWRLTDPTRTLFNLFRLQLRESVTVRHLRHRPPQGGRDRSWPFTGPTGGNDLYRAAAENPVRNG